MITEQTITIHHEPPPHTMDGSTLIMAYMPEAVGYKLRTANEVSDYWLGTYTAWYDPQVGEPMKARRYVVIERATRFLVLDNHKGSFVADSIPTREAAQAIADIYEWANGGEG